LSATPSGSFFLNPAGVNIGRKMQILMYMNPQESNKMFSTYGVDEWHQPTAADSESQGFKPISHIDMGIFV
jgi:hypothetical protein